MNPYQYGSILINEGTTLIGVNETPIIVNDDNGDGSLIPSIEPPSWPFPSILLLFEGGGGVAYGAANKGRAPIRGRGTGILDGRRTRH